MTGLICVPLYLRILGPEAYGLVGFFVATTALLGVLDLGITPAVNRQVARYRALATDAQTIRDFIRTTEIIYLAIGVGIGIVLFFLLPKLGARWSNAASIGAGDVLTALRIMGILAAVQWPISFYQGILFGLDRQLAANVVTVSSALLRSFGAVAVLIFVRPTALAFFGWQLCIATFQVASLALLAWSLLPPGPPRPSFRVGLLADIRHFAAGVGITSIFTFALRQSDKLVLIRTVSLGLFGYYSVASVIGGGLAFISAPVFTSAFPRFTILVERGDREEMIRLYHRACQFVALITAPLAVVLALYMSLTIRAWTGDPVVVANAAIPAAILTLGTFINGLVGVPYDIQIAHGFTRLGVYKNAIGVIILVPATYLLSKRYGLPGAAIAWLILNIGYLLIEMPIVHRRFLRGEGRRWLLQDTLLPTAAALIGALLFWPLRSNPSSRLDAAAFLTGAWVGATALALAVTPFFRYRVIDALSRLRERLFLVATKP